MKFKTRLISLALVLALCFCLCGVASAEDVLTPEEKAAALTELGLFRGKADARGNVSPALEDSATRAEAATMLIRLMGQEEKAKAQYGAGALRCIFTDVPAWAAANIAWLYEANYVNGMGGFIYGASNPVTAQQYATMVLRALGYSEADGDFKYAEALSFAVEKGLLSETQRAAYEADFRREGMVEMSYNALGLLMRESSLSLREKLAHDGVFRGVDMSVGTAPAMELTLKYSGGGATNPTYFEEKAFGNAVCGDLDGDGKPEIVFGVRSIFCIDAAGGKVKWRIPTGHDSSEGLDPVAYAMGEAFTYIPFRILDYDGDGKAEVFTVTNVAGSARCNIAVYDGAGRYKAHWTTENRIWAVCVEDFDGDGKCEVAVGFGVGEAGMSGTPSIYLYNNDGTLRWAKPCGYGMYSDSMTAADLDGDGRKELVLLYDESSIVAFHADGTEVTTAAFGGKKWSEIPFYEGIDGRYPYTARETSIGLMGTHSGILADDMDGDGKQELVCTGMFVRMGVVENNMANGVGVSFADSAQYFSPFLLNADRTRYKNDAKGYDWSLIPRDLGTIVSLPRGSGKLLSLDMPTMYQPSMRPIAADLEGDGEKEILFGSYDGKIHCFHLDGTEHGAWPYALDSRSASVISFASQPVAADVNGDGKLEVIFVSYTDWEQTAERGRLYILDYSGRVLAETPLPVMFAYAEDTVYPNGSQTAPCVADVDGDGKLEIAVATYSCGVCVYELN